VPKENAGMKTAQRSDVPWIPQAWRAKAHRVLVLGESAYTGSSSPENALAANWVPAYLREEVRDPLYSKVANAISGPLHGSGLKARHDFWNRVAFANFVMLSEGSLPDTKPSVAEYQAGARFLGAILDDLRPIGVWIWGIRQAKYSRPVVDRAKIASVVVAHPVRGYSRVLAESWQELLTAMEPAWHEEMRQQLENASRTDYWPHDREGPTAQ
jgi:hypothetical protein